MTRVAPIEFCHYCKQHVEEGHDCPYGPPKCPTDAGETCGICKPCLALMESDPRYRPASASDHPA
ncbi:hypothetical protein [Nonomuraea basaltis]|uniref:hypothetical protein n=1 Tax=Nonomuraea basaltis TaxID=2495887 RepID=UPI00110C4913|nr:hypothetical protein [Nonomuraea basaltis]TMS00121.1 hypothetical protein EJK15_03355 [Nonomuraea basaltis]